MNLKRKFLSAALAVVCGLNVCMTSAGFLTASAVEKVPGYDNVDNYMADSIINGYVSFETGESTEAYGLYNPDSTSLYAYEKLCADIVAEAGLESSADFMELNPELLGETTVQQAYEAMLMDYIYSWMEYDSDIYYYKAMKFQQQLISDLKKAGLASSEEAVLKLIESSGSADNKKTVAALKKLGYEKIFEEFPQMIEGTADVADNASDYAGALIQSLACQEINQDKIDLLTAMKESAADNEDFCNAVDAVIEAFKAEYPDVKLDSSETPIRVISNAYRAYYEKNFGMGNFGDKSAVENIFDSTDKTALDMCMLMADVVNQYVDSAVKAEYDEYDTSSNQDNAEDFSTAFRNALVYQTFASDLAVSYVQTVMSDGDTDAYERNITNASTQITITDTWYKNYIDYTDTKTVEIDFSQDVVEYNGHYYKVFNNSISWIYAKEYCELMGGHLATVADEDEQLVVEGVAQTCTDAENFWIGGYLSKETDEWTWVDGTPFEYENWDANQPDFHQREEFYIRFTNKDIQYDSWAAAMGKWNDCANEASGEDNEGDAVSIQTFAFICEWDSDDFQLDFIPGDANNDGEVSVRDAAYIAAALAKNEKEKLTLSADFNEDGEVSVRDAAAIAKYLATKK